MIKTDFKNNNKYKMIKDSYPEYIIDFEKILLENNYILNQNIFKYYIYKENNMCRRKNIENKEYCIRHLNPHYQNQLMKNLDSLEIVYIIVRFITKINIIYIMVNMIIM